MSLQHDLEFAIDLARGAGKIVLEHFGKVERLTKRHAEAVTAADRATQRFIVAGLKQRFPTDGIVGEENDTGDAITFDCPDPLGRVWVIDPIDGTNNFIAGFPDFAVCIGLLDRGQPVLGVVYEVCRDLVYSAAQGQGAYRGSQRVYAPPLDLNDSSLIMLTSNLLDKNGRIPAWSTKLIGQTNWKVRAQGSAALEAVQVASGIAYTAITVNGKLWDAVPPLAIALEAGAKVSDLKGNPIFPFDLKNYDGAKVPYLVGGPQAHGTMLRFMLENP